MLGYCTARPSNDGSRVGSSGVDGKKDGQWKRYWAVKVDTTVVTSLLVFVSESLATDEWKEGKTIDIYIPAPPVK